MSFAARPNDPAGLALLCDENGSFTIIRDDLGLCCDCASIFKVVDQGSAEKAGNFLKAITDQSAAFGWELNVVVQGAPTPFQFAGSRAGDKKLVIGGATRSDVSRLSEQLMAMNSEQSIALRNALKDLSLYQRDNAERDARMFDELSRLNNELVTLQREVARKNFELDRLNGLKNTFLGMASHDLRKPMAVIQMNVELLASAQCAPADHQKLAEGISSSCKTVMRQLNDFLDIAQIESGQLKLNTVVTNLSALVDSRLAYHHANADKKQISIANTSLATDAHLLIDPDRAAQVIDNLIENAIKYSPPGSKIHSRLLDDHSGIFFEVIDQGPGLTKEQIDQLFVPFKTVGVKTTAGERSSGLGLAIVKAIMDAHKGWFSVQSDLGKGAVFKVWFPKAESR